MYTCVVLEYPIDVTNKNNMNHVFTVLLENTHLGRRETIQRTAWFFREIDLIFFLRHMHTKTEMAMFTIRQLYVQFTMTIISIFPSV
jgi:hypothetical protein